MYAEYSNEMRFTSNGSRSIATGYAEGLYWDALLMLGDRLEDV
jgi:hypothetical protein